MLRACTSKQSLIYGLQRNALQRKQPFSVLSPHSLQYRVRFLPPRRLFSARICSVRKTFMTCQCCRATFDILSRSPSVVERGGLSGVSVFKGHLWCRDRMHTGNPFLDVARTTSPVPGRWAAAVPHRPSMGAGRNRCSDNHATNRAARSECDCHHLVVGDRHRRGYIVRSGRSTIPSVGTHRRFDPGSALPARESFRLGFYI